MAQELGKIFLGNTPSEQRKFVRAAFSFLREKRSANRVIIPVAGQFALVRCAIEAGFKPDQIYASDVSLFSSLLGYYFAGRPISDLEFKLAEQTTLFKLGSIRPKEEYQAITSEEERIAFLMWLVKLSQLKPQLQYEFRYFEDVVRGRERHIESIMRSLAYYKTRYDGLNYAIEDPRRVVTENYDEQTIVAVNIPPDLKKTYDKMSGFGRFIQFENDVEGLDFYKEYTGLYEQSKRLDQTGIWYRARNVKDFQREEVIFAKELAVPKYDFWLTTKPNRFAGFEYLHHTMFKTAGKFSPLRNAEIWGGDDDLLSGETQIRILKTKAEHALYYRELWAHRLGMVRSENYFLILLDGKVFGTVGFHHSDLLRLKSNKIFEVYGFAAPSRNYPNINRLLMYLITCEDMRKVLIDAMSKKNRFYDLSGFQTTCLAKYRHVKLNSGLLKITKRERMKNGMYKIVYECPFRPETFNQALAAYLTEFEKKELAKAQAETDETL